jgi:hypothetical protein
MSLESLLDHGPIAFRLQRAILGKERLFPNARAVIRGYEERFLTADVLVGRPVNKAVGNARNNGPELPEAAQ